MWGRWKGRGYQDELRIFRPANPCLRERLQRGNRRDRRRLRQVFLPWWELVELWESRSPPHISERNAYLRGAVSSRHEKKGSHSIRPLYLALRFSETPDFIGTVIGTRYFLFIYEAEDAGIVERTLDSRPYWSDQ